MSLTSYRAAPPRVMLSVRRVFFSDGPVELPGHFCLPFLEHDVLCERAGLLHPALPGFAFGKIPLVLPSANTFEFCLWQNLVLS